MIFKREEKRGRKRNTLEFLCPDNELGHRGVNADVLEAQDACCASGLDNRCTVEMNACISARVSQEMRS